MAIELPAQIAQVDVERQRLDGKEPTGHFKRRKREADAARHQTVAQRHQLGQPRVDHGQHAIAGPRVIGTQVPAESVKMWELPSIQNPTQQTGT